MRLTTLRLWLAVVVVGGLSPLLHAAIPVVIRPTSPPASSLPVVRSVVPSSAPVGTRLTIMGANLGAVVSVDFGGQSTSVLSRSATTVVVVVPPGAQSGRLTVNAPTESAKSSFVFTVTAPPAVDEFFPRSGPIGSNVTISGSELDTASAVQFGGVNAPIVSKLPNQIIVRVPTGAQNGPIAVVSQGSTARTRDPFEVTAAPRAPVLSEFSPTSGRPGTAVTIYGTDLSGVREVRFGTVRTTNFVILSATAIKVIVPSGIAPGPVRLSVVSGTGTAQSVEGFTIVAPSPTLFSINGRVTNSAGVGLFGVRVTRRSSAGSVVVTTDAAGNYTFTNLTAASYILTPELPGVLFTPASRTLSVTRDIVANADFTGSTVVQKFSLGGQVTNGGAAVSGVLVTRSRDGVVLASTFTNATGNYSFADVRAGTYTLSVAKSGFTFSPASRVVGVNANRSDVNFAVASVVTAPANDLFARARVLSGPNGRTTSVATSATAERGEPAHAGTPASASIWFRWTAPANGIVTFDTFDSNFDTVLAVYTGTTVSTLRAVTANDDADAATTSSRVAFNATMGTTYYLAVDGLTSGAGSATLNWRLAETRAVPTPTPSGPPRNDNIAAAQAIAGVSGRATGTNRNATREDNESYLTAERTVWYRWAAPSNGSVTFTTAGSTFDTVLNVFTGAALNDLQFLTGNDDALGVGTSEVRFSVTRGVVYYISVGGYRSAQGTVALSWTFRAAPANDNFAAAQVLSGQKGRVTTSNLNATREPGEPNIAGYAPLYSLWYRYTPSLAGKVTFLTAGSDFNTRLSVFKRANNGVLVELTYNNDDGNSPTSRVTFDAQAGATYYVAVDGFQNELGSIVLTWSTTYTLRVRLTTTETAVTNIGITLRGEGGRRTASTDATGVATFDDLPVGSYLVVPDAPSSTTGISPTSRTVEIKSNVEVSFAVSGPFTISGRVLDDKGAPVQYVYVYLDLNGSNYTASARTDGSGNYSFTDVVAPGTHTVTVTAPEKTKAETTVRTVTVTSANLSGVNFTILGPFTVSGRVVDDKGAPVEFVYAYLDKNGSNYTASARTDGNGNYSFTDVVAPGIHAVTLTAPNTTSFEPISQTITVTRSDIAGINFTILGPFTISGRVVDDKGAPVQYVYAYLDLNGSNYTASARTDGFGNYSFDNVVAPGTHSVTLTPPTKAAVEPIAQTVSVARTDVENVNFTILGPFSISGRVVNSAGVGLQYVTLTLKNAEGYAVGSARSDEIGKYSFIDLVGPGTYNLFITPPAGTTADPTSRTITIARADVIDANFTIRPSVTPSNSTQSTSSVVLSSAATSVSHATVALRFTGALNARDVVSGQCFSVTVNGRDVAMESTSIASNGSLVTLHLPQSTLKAGDKVTIRWTGLHDAKGRSLRDGGSVVTAR